MSTVLQRNSASWATYPSEQALRFSGPLAASASNAKFGALRDDGLPKHSSTAQTVVLSPPADTLPQSMTFALARSSAIPPGPPLRFKFKNVSPTLYDDPAFSPDPLSHPLFVTSLDSTWLSPPAAGHPSLRSDPRRPHSTGACSPFQPLPPPNSPMANEPIVAQSRIPPPLTLALPAPPEPQKKRTPSLLRRKSPSPVQPTPPVAPPPEPKSSNEWSLPPYDAAVAPRPPRARATSAPQVYYPPDEITPVIEPQRPMAPRRATEGRHRGTTLDRIDELDETNPLGLHIHHGGPYEAIQRLVGNGHSTKNRVPYNVGSQYQYHQDSLHTAQIDKPHKPSGRVLPPVGVSLNLVPGQIVPQSYYQPPQYQQPPQIFPSLPNHDNPLPDSSYIEAVHRRLNRHHTFSNNHSVPSDPGSHIAPTRDRQSGPVDIRSGLNVQDRHIEHTPYIPQPHANVEPAVQRRRERQQRSESLPTVARVADHEEPIGQLKRSDHSRRMSLPYPDTYQGSNGLHSVRPDSEYRQSQLIPHEPVNQLSALAEARDRSRQQSRYSTSIQPQSPSLDADNGRNRNMEPMSQNNRNSMIMYNHGTNHPQHPQFPERVPLSNQQPVPNSNHKNRFLPKRLVMPTPLQRQQPLPQAVSGAQSWSQPQYHPHSAPPSQHQSHQPPLPHFALPPTTLSGNYPLSPEQEADVSKNPEGRKVLRKRTSMQTGLPPPRLAGAPLAGPVQSLKLKVGYLEPSPAPQPLLKSKLEKAPKRVLSKRRTDF